MFSAPFLCFYALPFTWVLAADGLQSTGFPVTLSITTSAICPSSPSLFLSLRVVYLSSNLRVGFLRNKRMWVMLMVGCVSRLHRKINHLLSYIHLSPPYGNTFLPWIQFLVVFWFSFSVNNQINCNGEVKKIYLREQQNSTSGKKHSHLKLFLYYVTSLSSQVLPRILAPVLPAMFIILGHNTIKVLTV